MSWLVEGWLAGRQIMSPRETSMSSARRTTTDIPVKASVTGPSWGVDGGDGGGEPRRQDRDVVAGLEHAPGHLAGVAPVVVVGLGHGPDHVLDGESHVDEVAVRGDVDLLEVAQQEKAVVPVHVLAGVDHVVAVQGRDRHEGQVVDLQAGGEVGELALNLSEAVLVPVHQVDLVHGHDEVGNAQQGGDEGVAPGLLEEALAGVDEDGTATSAVEAPVTMLRCTARGPGCRR